jgi:hypothetical protein
MTDTVNSVLWLALVALVCVVATALFVFIPDPVRGDYTHAITVDKSEKIETAVSNVLDCLARRDFVLVSLRITRSFNGTYTVRGSGADRGNLIRRD